MGNAGLLPGLGRAHHPGAIAVADPTSSGGVAHRNPHASLGRHYIPGWIYPLNERVVGLQVLPYADAVTMAPLPVAAPTTLARIGTNVTSAAASSVAIGLYRSGPKGLPERLIWYQPAAIDVSTTGVKWFQLSTPLRLSVGLYWVGWAGWGSGYLAAGRSPVPLGQPSLAADGWTHSLLYPRTAGQGCPATMTPSAFNTYEPDRQPFTMITAA